MATQAEQNVNATPATATEYLTLAATLEKLEALENWLHETGEFESRALDEVMTAIEAAKTFTRTEQRLRRKNTYEYSHDVFTTVKANLGYRI